jgi:pimeloyl-ACP methyl ester carboxylesterase
VTNAKCNSDAITEWFGFVTGFQQREGGATPFEKLHRRVQKHAGGPNTVVVIRSWRDSAKDFAQRIHNWRNGHAPRIVLAGFSYGGYSAVEICRELQKFHIAVDHLFLIDPVARWLYRWPSIFSMLNILPITIPANVRRATVWRQTRNRPRGANVRVESKPGEYQDNVNRGTHLVIDPAFKFVTHENMDDQWDVNQRIFDCMVGV